MDFKIARCTAFAVLIAASLLLAGVAHAECGADPEIRPARLAYLFAASDYKHDYYADLPSAADDLAALSTALCDQLGFQVKVFEQATLEDMEGLKDRLPEDIAKLSDGPALVLVLFLGHGLNHYGVNFVAPTDVLPYDKHTSPIDIGFVKTDFLVDVLKSNNIAVGMLLVDACRTAPSRTSTMRRHIPLDNGTSVDPRRVHFSPIPPALDPQTLVSYSTTLGREAIVPQADGLGIYVAAIVQELPQRGQTVQNAFRDVSILVREATRGRSRPMEPELMVGELSSEAYLNPSEEQRDRIEKAFRNAFITQNKTAIREVAIDYPLAPLIPEAHAWCRKNGCSPSRLNASRGVVRIGEGCRYVDAGYDCVDSTNAFGNINQPMPRRASEANQAQRPELAAASRVRVEAADPNQVTFVPLKSPAKFSTNGWVAQKRVRSTTIPRKSLSIEVDDALNPAVWNRDNNGLHPCRVGDPITVCASVIADRFKRSEIRTASFEVLAVARPGSEDDKTERMRTASEFAVAVMAELIRMGAEPGRVSYYVADESFHPAFNGLAFVRKLRRS